MKQVRAVQTRRALVRAAAGLFDRDGYERTSLSAVSDAARVSKGALSFHFDSKAQLANAVEDEGYAEARCAVGVAARAGRTPLQTVIEVTHALGRLLEGDDALARAAVRLARERERGGPVALDWHGAWEPAVRVLLRQARADRSLRPEADLPAIEAMVELLVVGVELAYRRHAGAYRRAELTARFWRTALPGIAAPGVLPKLRVEGLAD
ncbi:TetR family transcriptional regulator [Kitasatospora sp. NBC_01539]|uniref:TetR family transcriptional regulator n=1 Tax=unclassified Kitasatospora TaxID=2633591 RepID=UPI00386029C9